MSKEHTRLPPVSSGLFVFVLAINSHGGIRVHLGHSLEAVELSANVGSTDIGLLSGRSLHLVSVLLTICRSPRWPRHTCCIHMTVGAGDIHSGHNQ